MWLFTDRGFYSAVEHRDDSSLLMIRARVRKDLENLDEILPDLKPSIKARITKTDNADYRYRIVISKVEWARICGSLVGRIDYDNFKDSVTRKQGKVRHDVYMSVWSAMLRLQPVRRLKGFPSFRDSRSSYGRPAGTRQEPRRLFDDEPVDTTRAWWEAPDALSGFDPIEAEEEPQPTGDDREDDYLLTAPPVPEYEAPSEEDLRWAEAFRAANADTQAGGDR